MRERAFEIRKNLRFHSLTLEQRDDLKDNFVGVFDFTYNRDRSDYVYSIEELIALKGKNTIRKKPPKPVFNQSCEFCL
ncbi:hypothetical protein HPHPP13_0417 [Helicobacter pylori Hp P-13]|nr:hypothetical protein HPHPP13_0417 [Helicobacter pylori Hp P-13]